MLKNNKGISLVTMVMTVLIMIILLSTLTYTAYANMKIRALNKLYNDIRTLNDKIAVYYMENGELPTESTIYETINLNDTLDDTIKFVTKEGTFTKIDDLINPNDYEIDDSGNGFATYYAINLELLDNISLENSGKYIINEQSHTIYYVDGVTVSGETYYNLPLTYKDTEYNVKHPISKITTSTIYLPMGGVTLNLKDYLTFTASDNNVAVPKSITYSAPSTVYSDYFSIDLDKGTITSNTTYSSSLPKSYTISVSATSYGTTDVKKASLTVNLIDLKLYDYNTETKTVSEISKLNLVKGTKSTIYIEKLGNGVGNLSLLTEKEKGNGINATVANTAKTLEVTTTSSGTTTTTSKTYYPITIDLTNVEEGITDLTVIESKGKASKSIKINVYDTKLSDTSISFTSLNENKVLSVSMGDVFTSSDYSVKWSSANSDVIAISDEDSTKKELTIAPTGFGTAKLSCDIILTDTTTKEETTLTTLTCEVTATGVSIEDMSMVVDETTNPTYTIDSNIESLISNVTITAEDEIDNKVLVISKNSETGKYEFTANKVGKSTVTITVTLTNGTVYKDTCEVEVKDSSETSTDSTDTENTTNTTNT